MQVCIKVATNISLQAVDYHTRGIHDCKFVQVQSVCVWGGGGGRYLLSMSLSAVRWNVLSAVMMPNECSRDPPSSMMPLELNGNIEKSDKMD